MNCPSCSTHLTHIDYENIGIETCLNCGGEWLDAEELKHIVQARETVFNAEERKAIAAAHPITGIELNDSVDRDLQCPKCDGTTDPINYGGDTGILIDKCTACGGIWLDAHEMEKIQQLVEGWEDQLPEDLKQYSKKLHDVSRKVDENDNVFTYSRIGPINAIMNGVLDLWMR